MTNDQLQLQCTSQTLHRLLPYATLTQYLTWISYSHNITFTTPPTDYTLSTEMRIYVDLCLHCRTSDEKFMLLLVEVKLLNILILNDIAKTTFFNFSTVNELALCGYCTWRLCTVHDVSYWIIGNMLSVACTYVSLGTKLW